MRYYRCKCGKRAAWSSMGVARCDGCEECGTTLAEGPNDHDTPEPHDWREEWTIDKQTGERGKERVCLSCQRQEALHPCPFCKTWIPGARISCDTCVASLDAMFVEGGFIVESPGCARGPAQCFRCEAIETNENRHVAQPHGGYMCAKCNAEHEAMRAALSAPATPEDRS